MFTKKLMLAALALTFGTAVSAGADAITFDPTGTPGPAGDIQVDLLDPTTGNSIAVGGSASLQVGQIVQALYQANLGTTSLGGGTPNFTNGDLGNYFTIVAGFQEQVLQNTPGGGTIPTTLTFTTVGGGQNFFNIYRQSAPGDNLSGNCFTCGTLVMSGVVNSGGNSSFSVFSPNDGALDQFNQNNYPATSTIGGVGAFRVTIDPTFVNTAFFPGFDLTNMFLFATSTQTDAYRQADPSACFTLTGAPNSTCTQVGVPTVGTVNGISGPNTMFQTDANLSPNLVAIPEPASLSLLGLGLSALAARRRAKAARA
jgi:hypothetical protein